MNGTHLLQDFGFLRSKQYPEKCKIKFSFEIYFRNMVTESTKERVHGSSSDCFNFA